MASFGSFETDREIFSGPAYTVFSARKAGDATQQQYALKLFHVRHVDIDVESAAALDPLMRDMERACLEGIAVQKRAASASANVSPILETGQDERGVWYVTPFFPRSVNKIISGRVALNRTALEHILRAIAQGALDIKRACGRSHGDIQGSNVQIGGSAKLVDAQVVLSDPLPGDATEAERYELADLQAIGRILLQLALQREISQEDAAQLVLPILATPEWTRLFSKDTERWLELCNRLLDPGLSVGQYSLEKLVQELELLRPKPAVSRGVLVGVAAGILVMGAGVMVAVLHFKSGNLLVTTDPPGAEIQVEVQGQFKSFGATTTDRKPLLIKGLPKGDYRLRGQYAGLGEQLQTVTVEGGKSRPYQLTFVYGLVQINSSPGSAAVEVNGKPVGSTPYASTPLPPGPQNYVLRLANYQSVRIPLVVSSNRQVVSIQTNLTAMRPGESSVEFRSDPEPATIREGDRVLGQASCFADLTVGSHTITAQYQDWQTSTQSIVVQAGDNRPVEFHFPHGIVRFEVTPPGASLFLNDKPLGGNVSRRLLQPQDYLLRATNAGYKAFEKRFTITDGVTTNIAVGLEPMFGFVELTSDPSGAEIRDEGGQLLGKTTREATLSVPLPPGPHTLTASYAGLDTVTQSGISVDLGARKTLNPFIFEYGSVTVAAPEPPDAQASAHLKVGDRDRPFNEVIYQKPNQTVAYEIQAQGYDPFATNVAVGAKQAQKVSVVLSRVKVPVKLTSDPAQGVRFFTSSGTELQGGGAENRVPWGALEVVARHPRLGALNQSTNLTFDGQYELKFAFDYGELVLTNLPDRITNIFELGADGKEQMVGLRAGATKYQKASYEKPGSRRYILRGGFKPQTNTVTIGNGVTTWVLPALGPPEWVNSMGMILVKLGEETKGPWVGKAEVTQAEYQKVMGNNPSTHQGPNFPVETLTWLQAKEFCQRLTQNDQSPPQKGGHYALPSLDEWKQFAAGATNLEVAVIRANQTAEAGSKGPDGLGLYDVLGNVNEWLEGPFAKGSGTNAYFMGGQYNLRFGFSLDSLRMRPGEKDITAPDPGVGFRVIWLPAD